jgi:hypothetical protein
VPLRSARAIVRDIYEVLREKEGAIEQVQREVQALYSVTPLLSNANLTIPQAAVGGEARTGDSQPTTGRGVAHSSSTAC